MDDLRLGSRNVSTIRFAPVAAVSEPLDKPKAVVALLDCGQLLTLKH